MELANCSMRLHNKEAPWQKTSYDELFEQFIDADPFEACDTTLDSKDDFGTYFDFPSCLSDSGSDFARAETPPRYPLQATQELGFACSAQAHSSRYPSSNFTSVDGSISPHALSACSPPLPAPTSSPVDFDFHLDCTPEHDLATALSQSLRKSLEYSDRQSVNLPSSPNMAQPSCSRPGHHESWSQRLEGNAERYDINSQPMVTDPPSPPKSTRTSMSTSDRNDQVKIPNFSHPFHTPITPLSDTFNTQHPTVATYDSSMSSHNQGQRGSQGHHRSGSSSYYQHHHSSNPNTPYFDESFFGGESGAFTSPTASEQGMAWSQHQHHQHHQQQQPLSPSQQWQGGYPFGTTSDLHAHQQPQQQQLWHQAPVFSPTGSPSYQMAGNSSQQRRAQVQQQQQPMVQGASYPSASFQSIEAQGLMIQGMPRAQPLTTGRSATATPYQAQHEPQISQYSSSVPQQQQQQLHRYRSAPSMNPHDVQSRRHRSSGTRSPSPNVALPGSSSQRATSSSTSAANTTGNRVARRSASTSASRSQQHRRTKTGGSTPRAASSAAMGFVNFTPDDSQKILTGVAPSGSSKTKQRRDREAHAKARRMSMAARRAIIEAGGDISALEREGIVFGEDKEDSDE